HVQRLLRIRASRQELRGGETAHLLVSEHVYVYRRGTTVVALNNGANAAEVTIPASALPLGALPADALGACGAGRAVSGGVAVSVPARSGCIF
ncbi:MAG: hypothetical protein ACLGIK_16330, partial [Gemmatimonadota bacterium]